MRGAARGTRHTLRGSPQPDPHVGLRSGCSSGPRRKAHGEMRETQGGPG